MDTTYVEERKQIIGRAITEMTPLDYILATQLDPDALASALLMEHIITEIRGIRTPIFYAGAIGHPQNRAIITACHLESDLHEISNLSAIHGREILVDSSVKEDARMPGVVLNPRIVIDHHIGDFKSGEGNNEQFFWVDDTVGAASTLVIELALGLGVEIPQRLLVPLALGIYTDTKMLTAASERDREAYGFVTKNADRDLIVSLINYPLPESHFKTLEYALGHRELRNGVMLVSAGRLLPRDSDDLSSIADDLLRMVGVTTVIVWGIVENTVRISARSVDISDPLHNLLIRKFGSGGAKFAPDGRAEGGARIPLDLGFWGGPFTYPQIEALVSARIRNIVYDQS